MSLFRTSLGVCALLLVGCGGSGDVSGFDGSVHDLGGDGAPVDAGPHDGAADDGTGGDGSTPDGSMPDGATPDGSSDDGSTADGSTPDGSTADGSTPDGSTTDGSTTDGATPDGATADGSAPDASTTCDPVCTSDADCGAARRCLPTECPAGTATQHCEVAGRPCITSGDCNAGERCETSVSPSACVTVDGSECVSGASCPQGYACEADVGGVRHCIDRRATCDFASRGCPAGFWCGAQYCLREVRRCTTVSDCFLLLFDPDHTCADADGDGMSECLHVGGCTTNADCPSATCDATLDHVDTACGPGGFCASDAACASGTHCVDVHGDGFRQCLPLAGCQRDADCPAGQLCSDWGSGTATCRG